MFNLNLDQDALKKELEAQRKEILQSAEKKMEYVIKQLLDSYFTDGRHNASGRPGVGHSLIKEHIETVLTSPEFTARMNAYLDKHFEQRAEECMTQAINHHLKKIAFERAKKLSEGQ